MISWYWSERERSCVKLIVLVSNALKIYQTVTCTHFKQFINRRLIRWTQSLWNINPGLSPLANYDYHHPYPSFVQPATKHWHQCTSSLAQQLGNVLWCYYRNVSMLMQKCDLTWLRIRAGVTVNNAFKCYRGFVMKTWN